MTNRLMAKSALTSLLVFLSLACDSNDEVQEVTEENLILTAGNYTGLWTSNTATQSFNNLPISARIVKTEAGGFEGSFFISGIFVSCCNSGEDDGKISFMVNEEQVTDFVWNDIIPGCTGKFEGTGLIVSENSFTIDFTGVDCDGDHQGKLSLSKK